MTLPSTPDVATDCNCSLCRRIGGPWVYFEFGTVKIEGHPEATSEYIWGDRTLRTIHCTTCGCVTHWEPLDPVPGAKHGVNLGNFDPGLIASVRVRRFDGANTWKFATPLVEAWMKVTGLGWMGIKTRRFDSMITFYRDVLNLGVVSIDDKSGRFKLDDGTEVHVYGPNDGDHEFFGNGPVVAFEVDSFAVARNRLLSAGIEFIYPEPQRASGRIWQHFRAPDGNVYEIIGNDVAA